VRKEGRKEGRKKERKKERKEGRKVDVSGLGLCPMLVGFDISCDETFGSITRHLVLPSLTPNICNNYVNIFFRVCRITWESTSSSANLSLRSSLLVGNLIFNKSTTQ
jgi:hypothetical protein